MSECLISCFNKHALKVRYILITEFRFTVQIFCVVTTLLIDRMDIPASPTALPVHVSTVHVTRKLSFASRYNLKVNSKNTQIKTKSTVKGGFHEVKFSRRKICASLRVLTDLLFFICLSDVIRVGRRKETSFHHTWLYFYDKQWCVNATHQIRRKRY